MGGLCELMGTLFPQLQDVWSVPKQQCDFVGGRWEKYAEKRGDAMSPGLLKLIDALPALGAYGATAIVLFPRFRYTIRYVRDRKSLPKPPQRVDPFNPTQPPPNGAPQHDDTGFPGAYDDEPGNAYAGIDGTEAAAS